MPERPLLIPLGSLIAGLCAADAVAATPPAWALAAALVATLAACLVPARFPFLLSLALLFFVLGACSLEPFFHPSDSILHNLTEQPVLIEGVVDQRPEGTAAGGGRVHVRVVGISSGNQIQHPVTGRLLVQIGEGRARFFTGDRILFASRIRKPRTLGLPGESDYPRRLAYQGIFATGFVRGADDLVLVRAGSGWRHGIDRLADSLGRFISREAPGVEGGVLKALLLGDSGDVPESLSDLYGRSGVNHILSISGFHVGIIFLCVFQLLFLVCRRCEFLALRLNLRTALLVVTLPVVVFYLFLSGAAPATVRSVLMIVAFIFALQLRREVEPVNTVMVAACAILLCAPETLFDVSFELSFLAIWGLVVLAPPLAAPVAGAGKTLRWFLLLFAASAAAILATLVPTAYYFHRVSFIGLMANLVIVPLMGYGAVVAGFASLPLSFVAPLPAALLLRLAAWLVKLSDQTIFFLARAPVYTGYAPTGCDVLIACLVLCAVTFVRKGAWRSVTAISLVLILIVRAVPAGGVDGRLRIEFLSVGQGDAALIWLPDGKTMLVDGGGRAGAAEERAGERILLPALWRLGVGRIDYLVFSHEHPDHLQGVLYLARHFDVGELWESGVPGVTREYLELNWLAAARGIPVRIVNALQPPFVIGGAVLEPLWPVPALVADDDDANDSSLVFRLRHGKSTVLFTGDLGAVAERELLARGAQLQSSVLKVGHHGSKYSSSEEFLAAVSPQSAVISAGYLNAFHLPAPSTLRRLQRIGARVYRTDLDGTVEALCGADGEVIFNISRGVF